MKRYASLALVLCALVVVASAGPVWAGEERPFKLSALATYVGYYQEGKLHIGVFELEGNATHLGNFTGVGLVEYPPPDRLPTGGTLTIESTDGDTLVIRTESSHDPDTGASTGTFLITDGSGKFAGASGGGFSSAVNAAPGTVNVDLEGTISY